MPKPKTKAQLFTLNLALHLLSRPNRLEDECLPGDFGCGGGCCSPDTVAEALAEYCRCSPAARAAFIQRGGVRAIQVVLARALQPQTLQADVPGQEQQDEQQSPSSAYTPSQCAAAAARLLAVVWGYEDVWTQQQLQQDRDLVTHVVQLIVAGVQQGQNTTLQVNCMQAVTAVAHQAPEHLPAIDWVSVLPGLLQHRNLAVQSASQHLLSKLLLQGRVTAADLACLANAQERSELDQHVQLLCGIIQSCVHTPQAVDVLRQSGLGAQLFTSWLQYWTADSCELTRSHAQTRQQLMDALLLLLQHPAGLALLADGGSMAGLQKLQEVVEKLLASHDVEYVEAAAALLAALWRAHPLQSADAPADVSGPQLGQRKGQQSGAASPAHIAHHTGNGASPELTVAHNQRISSRTNDITRNSGNAELSSLANQILDVCGRLLMGAAKCFKNILTSDTASSQSKRRLVAHCLSLGSAQTKLAALAVNASCWMSLILASLEPGQPFAVREAALEHIQKVQWSLLQEEDIPAVALASASDRQLLLLRLCQMATSCACSFHPSDLTGRPIQANTEPGLSTARMAETAIRALCSLLKTSGCMRQTFGRSLDSQLHVSSLLQSVSATQLYLQLHAWLHKHICNTQFTPCCLQAFRILDAILLARDAVAASSAFDWHVLYVGVLQHAQKSMQTVSLVNGVQSDFMSGGVLGDADDVPCHSFEYLKVGMELSQGQLHDEQHQLVSATYGDINQPPDNVCSVSNELSMDGISTYADLAPDVLQMALVLLPKLFTAILPDTCTSATETSAVSADAGSQCDSAHYRPGSSVVCEDTVFETHPRIAVTAYNCSAFSVKCYVQELHNLFSVAFELEHDDVVNAAVQGLQALAVQPVVCNMFSQVLDGCASWDCRVCKWFAVEGKSAISVEILPRTQPDTACLSLSKNVRTGSVARSADDAFDANDLFCHDASSADLLAAENVLADMLVCRKLPLYDLTLDSSVEDCY